MIEGLSPAISIEQKNAPKNPRSTVATVTEIYDYMRVLYAEQEYHFHHLQENQLSHRPLHKLLTKLKNFQKNPQFFCTHLLFEVEKVNIKKKYYLTKKGVLEKLKLIINYMILKMYLN